MSDHEHIKEENIFTELFRLGEEFQLFQPERTDKYYFKDEVVHLFSHLCLATDVLDLFLITIFGEFENTFARIEVVTPFNPQQGYPLDKDDFSADSRKSKLERLKDDLFDTVEGFTLLVGYAENSPRNVFRAGISAPIQRFLEGLHLVLSFPNGSSFVSRAYYHPRALSLTFDKFFPSDTGPLPVLEPVKTEERLFRIDEGFRILVPADLEKLESIKGKFVYIPQ